QHEQPGDAVVGGDGVVVDQLLGLLPAFVVVQRAGRAGPSGRGEGQGTVDVVGDGPSDEVTGPEAGGGHAAGQPEVKVGLSAGGRGRVATSQPVEETDGGADVLADGVELPVGGLGVAVALSQPA